MQISICWLSSTLAKAFRLCFDTEFTFSQHQSTHKTHVQSSHFWLKIFQVSLWTSNSSPVTFTSSSCFPTISSLFLYHPPTFTLFSSYINVSHSWVTDHAFLASLNFDHTVLWDSDVLLSFGLWRTSATFVYTSRLNSSITPFGRLPWAVHVELNTPSNTFFHYTLWLRPP